MKGRRPGDDAVDVLAPLAVERSIDEIESIEAVAVPGRAGPGSRARRLGAWAVGLALIGGAIGLAVRSADVAPGSSSASSTTGSTAAATTAAPPLPPSTTPSATERSSVTRHGPAVSPEAIDRSRSVITGSPSIGVPTTREPHGPYLLAPTGTRLLVADDGDLVEIDLDTGVERTIAENLGDELYPVCCMVHDGWVVTLSGRPVLAIPLAGGGGEPVPLGDACGGFPSATPGRWWVYECTEDGRPELREVDLADGTVTGEARPPASSRVYFAVPDGLVIGAGGGLYVGQDGTFDQIATGKVEAVLGRIILLSECDEALRCTTTLFDPATGERRPAAFLDALNWPGVSFGEPFSAEAAGRQVVVIYTGGPPEYRLFDSTTGELISLPDQGGQLGAAALSPDGQWVFWSSGAAVRGWHVGDPDTVAIDLDGRTLVSGY